MGDAFSRLREGNERARGERLGRRAEERDRLQRLPRKQEPRLNIHNPGMASNVSFISKMERGQEIREEEDAGTGR